MAQVSNWANAKAKGSTNSSGNKYTKIEQSITSLGGSKITVLENYAKAKQDIFKDHPEKIKQTLEYIFSNDPEAISPIDEITSEYKNSLAEIDTKVEMLINKTIRL